MRFLGLGHVVQSLESFCGGKRYGYGYLKHMMFISRMKSTFHVKGRKWEGRKSESSREKSKIWTTEYGFERNGKLQVVLQKKNKILSYGKHLVQY